MARSNGPGSPHASPHAARPPARPAARQQQPHERQAPHYPDELGQGYAAEPHYPDQQDNDHHAFPAASGAPYDPRYGDPAYDPQLRNPVGQSPAGQSPVVQSRDPAGYAGWNEQTQPPREAAGYPQHADPYAAPHGGREPGFDPGFGAPQAARRATTQGQGQGQGQDQGRYAPQFDPYLPQPAAQAPAYPSPHDPYAEPRATAGVQHSGYPAQAGHGREDYTADEYAHQGQAASEPWLRGAAYDDHTPTAPPSRADVRYSQAPDTGHYAEPAYPAEASYPESYDTGFAHSQPGLQSNQRPAAQPGYASDDYGQHGYAEPGFGSADGYASGVAVAGHGHGHGGQAGQGLNQSLEPVYDDEYEVEEDYEEEEPRRSGRMFLIAGALIGAIAVGGGLAYGYKILLGPAGQAGGKPPVVTSGAEPTKVRPEEPGGRQFSHTDSKIMDRLDTNRTSPTATNPDGTRRVNTIVIGRDGAPLPPQTAPTPSGAAPINPVVSVPGLTVVDAFAGARAQAPQQPPTSTGPIVVSPPSAPAKPVVITNTAPTPPKAPPAAKTEPRAPTQTAAITPKPPAAPPRKTASTAAPAPVTSSGGNGYVAVLASVPVSGSSQMDSLKTFADIQQRYPSVLANKTPEVREANLGEKGRYHRLLVGPPASRTQANELCRDLKSAGYSSCWITSF